MLWCTCVSTFQLVDELISVAGCDGVKKSVCGVDVRVVGSEKHVM